MTQSAIQHALRLGMEHFQAGRLSEATDLSRQVLAKAPENPQALFLLGLVSAQSGRPQAAAELLTRVVRLRPNNAPAYFNLGYALQDLGRFDEAIAAFKRVLEIMPKSAEAHASIGNVLRDKGQLDNAVAAFKQAIAINPQLAGAHSNLATVLRDLDRFDEAVSAGRRAVELHPDLAEAHLALGNALRARGRYDEAAHAFQQALRIKPQMAEARGNLSGVYRDQGRADQAIESYRQALSINPDDPTIRSGLIFAMHYHAQTDAPGILHEAKEWSERHGKPLAIHHRPHWNDRSPTRRLRIGYVSADFRSHAVACFLLPLLQNHHPEQVEIFCYSNVRRPDQITERIQQASHHWCDATKLRDADLAETIRGDQIDILVDLGLHTADNRLMIFARKPAPVQVSWLGFPGTTGLSTMDYRLTDPYLDPPGKGDEFYVEKSIRLPATAACYQPLIAPPRVGPLPAEARGFVTFGSFNNFAKVSAESIRLWIRVLRAVKGSHLLVKAEPGSHVDAMREMFEKSGIEKDRLEVIGRVPTEEYFSLYDRVDICVDAVPYSGYTTSLDGLWMGVPLITARGRTAVGRSGVSILSNLGLTDWIAGSPSEFVEIARKKSADLPALAKLRGELRQRMRESRLMNAAQFATDIESAYRRMWETWCAGA
ncbi:MAG: tetratricopeptide repeat protein [Tepidisphaeraceae bacterium]